MICTKLRNSEDKLKGASMSPKWCPQLFLTIIFRQVWVFNLIMQSKNIKKMRFGVGLCFKPSACVCVFNLRD